MCLLLSSIASAQAKPKVSLQVNETIFSVVTAMNTCGYSDGMNSSDPVRLQVRKAVEIANQSSPEAAAAVKELCQFYSDHKPNDPNRDLSQYISLALYLGDPPDFKPRVKEADMPPDTDYVLGFVGLVSRFYKADHLHDIWLKVQPQYQQLMDKFNPPLVNMILQTDVYLKNPISGDLGRSFIIYMEPMAGPGQVNARNYGEDYFLVASPVNGELPMDQVRHTYLHFLLDSYSMKRPTAMKRLAPLLNIVQGAPLEPAFKTDMSLLVTESLIRAIEARLMPGGKAADAKRIQEVEEDMAEGFVLTHYFYDALVKWEAEPTSLKDAFPDFLYYMDVGKQVKLASQIKFSTNLRSEVVKGGKVQEKADPLDLAQMKLGQGDLEGAEKLAQEVKAKNDAESPRACFILGEVATLQKDKDGAISYFEQTLRTAKEPNLIAWSHIYLGRIYDVDQDRDLAVKHYQAALAAGDDSPQVKTAAETGLKAPYERRQASPENQENQ